MLQVRNKFLANSVAALPCNCIDQICSYWIQMVCNLVWALRHSLTHSGSIWLKHAKKVHFKWYLTSFPSKFQLKLPFPVIGCTSNSKSVYLLFVAGISMIGHFFAIQLVARFLAFGLTLKQLTAAVALIKIF